MPNPKRRHSKRRTSTRRAHDALKLPQLVNAPIAMRRSGPTGRVRIAVCTKAGK